MNAFPFTGAGAEGMTLRDYFAARILQGLVSRSEFNSDFSPELIYQWADAMMKAREQ